MGHFDRDEKRSGGGGFGGRSPMNPATCTACGASCEVPFKPTGDRPVYCRDCFGKQGGGGARHDKPRFGDKQMYDAVCAKCAKECQVPFRPAPGKPIYCSNCFERGGSGSGGSRERDSGAVAEQLKMLNGKVDKLIALFTQNATAAKEAVEEVVKEKKEKSVSKKTSGKKKK